LPGTLQAYGKILQFRHNERLAFHLPGVEKDDC